jgi:hypothetical protein
MVAPHIDEKTFALQIDDTIVNDVFSVLGKILPSGAGEKNLSQQKQKPKGHTLSQEAGEMAVCIYALHGFASRNLTEAAVRFPVMPAELFDNLKRSSVNPVGAHARSIPKAGRSVC